MQEEGINSYFNSQTDYIMTLLICSTIIISSHRSSITLATRFGYFP